MKHEELTHKITGCAYKATRPLINFGPKGVDVKRKFKNLQVENQLTTAARRTKKSYKSS
jgi:hypothetical protein